jgi:hypothetical protein
MGRITLVFFGWLFGKAMSLSASVSFVYPRHQPILTINIVDNVIVQWTSNYEQAFLYFYCPNGTVSGDVKCKLDASSYSL